jgi:predicted phosphohydrolase
MSDLHFEFMKDRGKAFCEAQDPAGVDVLCLAGDITTQCNEVGLSILASKFKHVLYVFGNHEYYNSNYNKILEWGRGLNAKYPNLHFLENDIVVIEGQRFLGTTLWTPDGLNNWQYEPMMNDFTTIWGGAKEFIYGSNTKAVKFLEDNTQDGDFVITHHLPSHENIKPPYIGNKLNIFFVNDLDHILYDKDLIWTAGHTHSSQKFKIGRTDFNCNPFGYVPSWTNPDFNDKYDINL